MLYMWMIFSMSYKIMKTKWYKKRNWYFIACIWDTSDTSAWYNDYAGSRRSAGQFNKIFLSSIGLNTQWGFFWCLKINDFQPKPRVCLWPRDWEGNQAWSDASADHVHLRPWIWNRKQDFKFRRKRRCTYSIHTNTKENIMQRLMEYSMRSPRKWQWQCLPSIEI